MTFYELYDFQGIGYEKLFHHRDWRVAVLNYIEELEVKNLVYMEAHHETDEVFVLLQGQCIMFFAEVSNQEIQEIQAIQLEPHKVYKIPAGVYHTHTLSLDAKLLIVEEENTCYDNSPRVYLTDQNKDLIRKRYEELTHEL